jgi:hypothetical protein
MFLTLGWAAAGAAKLAPAPAATSGPLVLQNMDNGFAVAPEVKVTKLDGQVVTLAGASAGWINDQRLFAGGAVYFMTDPKQGAAHRNMDYGGFLVGWAFDPGRPVSVSTRALLGAGRFAENQTFDLPCRVDRRHEDCGDAVGQVRFVGDFLLAEPEIDVVARLNQVLSVTAGAGYRWTTFDRRSGPDLRGATGTIAVRFEF